MTRPKTMFRSMLAALALLTAPLAAPAATLEASTTDEANAQAEAAKPGDVLVLHGQLDVLTLKGKAGLTIDARDAALAGLVAYDSDFTLKGGLVLPPDDKVGVMAHGGSPKLEGVAVSGGRNGVVFTDCAQNALLGWSNVTGFGGDGAHVFGAQHVRIVGNFIGDGVSDGVHHPDQLQFHNLPDCQVQDVVVTGNDFRGDGQGLNNFDGPRNAYGGRMVGLVFTDNHIAVSYAHAITLGACDGCAIMNNIVDLKQPSRFRMTQVRVPDGTKMEGNRFGAGVKVVTPEAQAGRPDAARVRGGRKLSKPFASDLNSPFVLRLSRASLSQ